MLMKKKQGNKLWGSIAVTDYTRPQIKERKRAKNTQ